jgi:hypothetical protein
MAQRSVVEPLVERLGSSRTRLATSSNGQLGEWPVVRTRASPSAKLYAGENPFRDGLGGKLPRHSGSHPSRAPRYRSFRQPHVGTGKASVLRISEANSTARRVGCMPETPGTKSSSSIGSRRRLSA